MRIIIEPKRPVLEGGVDSPVVVSAELADELVRAVIMYSARSSGKDRTFDWNSARITIEGDFDRVDIARWKSNWGANCE